jgi:hypothetical protein
MNKKLNPHIPDSLVPLKKDMHIFSDKSAPLTMFSGSAEIKTIIS